MTCHHISAHNNDEKGTYAIYWDLLGAFNQADILRILRKLVRHNERLQVEGDEIHLTRLILNSYKSSIDGKKIMK